MSKTQNEAILAHLKRGFSLTSMEALNLFGCFRLAARISDLKDTGVDIRDDYETKNGKTYKVYWIHKPKPAPDIFLSEDAVRQHEGAKV